jgi:hypothetical protein
MDTLKKLEVALNDFRAQRSWGDRIDEGKAIKDFFASKAAEEILNQDSCREAIRLIRSGEVHRSMITDEWLDSLLAE